MCLIVAAKPNIPLTEEFVEDVIKRNQDGFGTMWIDKNKLNTYRSPTDSFDEVWTHYNKIKHLDHFIHFRMKTHGEIDLINTHPYNCGFGIHLMHNGVIWMPHDTQRDKTKSDTWHFIEDIIKPLFKQARNPHELIRTKAFQTLIGEYIGNNNRIVFGDNQGFVIINPNSWVEIKNKWTNMVGVLVSNSYAWNENGFRDPDILKQEQERKTTIHQFKKKNRGREGYSKGSALHGTNSDQLGFHNFRHTQYDLEDLGDDWFVDSNSNLWYKAGHGFRRIYNKTFDQLLKEFQAEHAAKQKAIEAGQQQLMLPVPMLPQYTQEEIDKKIDDYYANLYLNNLANGNEYAAD